MKRGEGKDMHALKRTYQATQAKAVTHRT